MLQYLWKFSRSKGRLFSGNKSLARRSSVAPLTYSSTSAQANSPEGVITCEETLSRYKLQWNRVSANCMHPVEVGDHFSLYITQFPIYVGLIFRSLLRYCVLQLPSRVAKFLDWWDGHHRRL